MSGFFKKVGIGLDNNELYSRAFEKGVLLKNFGAAADIFEKAAKKFTESGNPAMAAQATANSLLYRYLATGDTNAAASLLKILPGLQQIEAIGSQTEMMPPMPLAAELDCRLVEVAIAGAQNNIIRCRDLHGMARDKFQAIMRDPLATSLLTYGYRPDSAGHNEKAESRYFYHSGMFSFYEAMVKKELDPSAASNDLAEASRSFKMCNDQKWQPHVAKLLTDWRTSRTCWICHRDMQGFELHYSMCHADVKPYVEEILKRAKEDVNTIDRDKQQIAVCTPCGSMINFKAEVEADKVRQELNAKISELSGVIQALNNRVSHLERLAHHH